jgi:predicted ATPase
MNTQELRPYREVDPTTVRLLAEAYRYLKDQNEPISAELLRYTADADEAVLERAVQLQLVTQCGNQVYRPTLLGLLYLPEAEQDVQDVHRLAEYAHRTYRPGLQPIEGEALAATTGLSVERLMWLTHFAGDADLNLYGREKPTLAIHEQNRRVPGLAAALARRFPQTPGPSIYGQIRALRGLPPSPFRTRITRLAVKGFRVLSDVELPLEALTVFVGPNGAGKSTVLDALALLAAATNDGVVTALEANGGIMRQRTRGFNERLTLTAHFELDYSQTEHASADYSFALGELHGRVLVEEERLTSDGVDFIEGTRGRARVRAGIDAEVRYNAPDTLVLATLDDEQKYPLAVGLRESLSRILLIDRDPVVRESGGFSLFGRGPRLRERFTATGSEILGEALKSDEKAKQLGELVRQFIPGIAEIQREVVTNQPSRLRAVERASGAVFELDELSAGTRAMVLLCGIYVFDRPPTLLLLEEPDAGLSAASLPALKDLLQSLATRMQVIATTHSAPLVGLLDPHTEVKALERDEHGAAIRTLKDALASRKWLASFSDAEAFRRLDMERS